MKHRRPILFLLALILILSQREVRAQSIPLMIPHSGTVTVNGTPFNGSGLFKFAIVNKDCTLSPPGAACATLWSNDNTSTAGAEPTAAVTLPVTNGAFAVKLGDITLTNMQAIPTAGVFNIAETYLRIWFNDGATGSQLLSPDRQLVSVPYAYHAETAGSVTGAGVVGTTQIAAGAVTNTQIASGAVTSTQIAAGAVGSLQINTSQVQDRVTGSCATGTHIRSINADGTVVCSQLITVVVSGPTVAAGSFGSAVASCPAGFVAVGGGVDPANVFTVVITSSNPRVGGTRTLSLPDGTNGAPTEWLGVVRNNDTIGNTFKVAVICTN